MNRSKQRKRRLFSGHPESTESLSGLLKKPPGEGTGPAIYIDSRGNPVGRVPSHGERDVFKRAASELPMPVKTSSWLHPKFSVLSVISCSIGLLSGCSRAPTFDIVGSFFPAWLVCFIAGIFLASFAHWLLSRLKIVLLVPILVYPSLAALFTFMLWLIFFG